MNNICVCLLSRFIKYSSFSIYTTIHTYIYIHPPILRVILFSRSYQEIVYSIDMMFMTLLIHIQFDSILVIC